MPNKVFIDVTLKKGNGALNSWAVIDNQPIEIKNDGKGVCETDDRSIHTYVVWLEGPQGATADFEFKNGSKSLVKDKLTVSFGNMSQVQTNSFAHV